MRDYATEIAAMLTEDIYRTKANDLFNNVICQALWAIHHEEEAEDIIALRRKAAEEADAYFAELNKEEIPLAATISIQEDRLKRSARRKANIRHKAKNAETLRRIYDKTKPDIEFNRRTDHAALDFKFFGRDIEDLVTKGKRLSEIGGVPKRKNYSKATRRDPDVPMRGSGYKKSQNWRNR